MTAGEWVDCAFAAVVLWCMFWGVSRGLIREVIGLVGIVAAFVVAGAFYRGAQAGSGIDFALPATWMAQGVWYLILWLVVWIAFKGINWLVHKATVDDDKKLAFGNRMAGGVFGILKGALVVGFIAFFLAGFDTNKVPMGGPMENVVGNSATVHFARKNPQLLGHFERSNMLEGANDYLLDFGTNRVLDYLEIEDEDLRAQGRNVLRPILEDPELFTRLGSSPTAAAAVERFEANDAFDKFMSSTPEVDKARAKDTVVLADLMDIVKTPQAKALFKDEGFRKLVAELDIAKIKAELETPEEG